MGPIIVIGAGALALLWFFGLLTPPRLRLLGAATAALVALRLLAMGRPLIAGGLFALSGWLVWMNRGASARSDPAAEARRLLGVRRDASEAEINAAWRARMAELHPDRGGNDQAASAVNIARDVLLGELADRRR